ncbi:hypothetical protein Cgig2_019197 [Carnegiea gigantea]|uniref:Reverse transcriptase n=1 Tax=Carnegiea gigantea TaxID=171969 RepID=A0A9Q1QB69_9CARY|nr:hypothetical protein Cgig2_019197 [Carnegiea gigantea]
MDAFKEFVAASRMQINVNKSHILSSGNQLDLKLQLTHIIGLSKGKLPFKYLEAPIPAGRLSYSDCQLLVEKITAKTKMSGNRNLLRVTLITLIDSVLMGVYGFRHVILSLRGGKKDCLFHSGAVSNSDVFPICIISTSGPFSRWKPFLEACLQVAVRGGYSLELLLLLEALLLLFDPLLSLCCCAVINVGKRFQVLCHVRFVAIVKSCRCGRFQVLCLADLLQPLEQ